MPPALRIVDSVRGKAATWFAANADGCIGLAIGSIAVCEITPAATGADGFVLTWQADSLRSWREPIAGPDTLETVAAAAARWFCVLPPAADFLSGFRDLAPTAAVPAPLADEGLLARFADLLAAILDDPLTTLPGPGPDGGPPLELRLSHFRPDLVDLAATLLDEAGR